MFNQKSFEIAFEKHGLQYPDSRLLKADDGGSADSKESDYYETLGSVSVFYYVFYVLWYCLLIWLELPDEFIEIPLKPFIFVFDIAGLGIFYLYVGFLHGTSALQYLLVLRTLGYK